MRGRLVRIEATYLCCGVIVDDAYVVTEAAPILRWSVGKHCREIKRFLERKGAFVGWQVIQPTITEVGSAR
jgi:hypothetical protein